MEKIINKENLRSYAYTNEKQIQGKPKGIILDFFGLGCQAMYHDDTDAGKYYGQSGALLVVPYSNPWGWMNDDEVRLTDEILDVIFEKYGLDENTPIVSTGGSMGGLACIVYTKYAKRTPVACVSNCPVCDLPFHYTERVDLPRTLYSAFYSYDCTLDEALKKNSPLHLASTLPMETEYVVFHCAEDSMVNIHAHSDKFVNELSKYKPVEYYIVPDKDHCCFDEETTKKFRDVAISFITKK